ncbi:gallinacin-1-like [Pogoniulus pusillus]|uniref:gallinacin-1-like n=1 Tax=Pogoniulus pusillus TaxID=488313 RepID=UPI0030B9334D
MKMLYLLFPFLILLFQGAAGTGGSLGCSQRGGQCFFRRCPPNTIPSGRCSIFRKCCRR